MDPVFICSTIHIKEEDETNPDHKEKYASLKPSRFSESFIGADIVSMS